MSQNPFFGNNEDAIISFKVKFNSKLDELLSNEDIVLDKDEKTLRDAMRKFKPDVSNFIWTDVKTARREYTTAKGVDRVLPSKKRVKYYNLLKGLDVEKCSVKELKEVFKEIDKLEFIQYPEYVEGIVHPRLAKEEK